MRAPSSVLYGCIAYCIGGSSSGGGIGSIVYVSYKAAYTEEEGDGSLVLTLEVEFTFGGAYWLLLLLLFFGGNGSCCCRPVFVCVVSCSAFFNLMCSGVFCV